MAINFPDAPAQGQRFTDATSGNSWIWDGVGWTGDGGGGGSAPDLSGYVLKTGDTMTGTLVVPNATAATPSLVFTGDLDTGIWSPGPDEVAVSTNGFQRAVIDSSGDITIAGGGLIKADFTNEIIPNRTNFQTTTANATTNVGAIPNGTGISSCFLAFNNSDPTNASYAGIYAVTTYTSLRSDITGTGPYLPLAFETNNQEQARFTTTDRYFRMAAGTGGIQFNGDTAAANALADYEEGTFTPVIEGTTTAGTGTYTSQVGRYTKTGNRVQYNLVVQWTAHTGTGNLRVAGLPFTSQSTGNNLHPAALYSSNLTTPANHYPAATVVNNTTTLSVYSIATGGSALALLAMDTAATLYISGHYETAT
jgi:hypothetical protein